MFRDCSELPNMILGLSAVVFFRTSQKHFLRHFLLVQEALELVVGVPEAVYLLISTLLFNSIFTKAFRTPTTKAEDPQTPWHLSTNSSLSRVKPP